KPRSLVDRLPIDDLGGRRPPGGLPSGVVGRHPPRLDEAEHVAVDAFIHLAGLPADLQLEGITTNQAVGLDETDTTAEAVLRAVLAKANPDGKLVFVVRKKDGQETIEITTRAAAQKRGDTLPAGQ
ncbi:MAG: hypothetical protein ACKONH_08475, partial [Planctomycetia bacterium]